MEKAERRQSSVVIKIFSVQCLYMMEQKIDTPPTKVFKFLLFPYIQILPKIFSKNLAVCNRKLKVLEADKVV